MDNLMRFNRLCNGIVRVPKKSAKASLTARQQGNEFFMCRSHNKKVHLDILSFYNKSLAFAEDGSEEMALAYSNRSALLLHLCKYQECLVDIERAYQITKSEELRVKLLTRKMKCLKLMDEKSQPLVKNEDKEIGTIESYAVGERSKTIPCAYDCVTLAYNEKYGRHLVATKDIEPGQVVVIEKIFAQFPSRDNMPYLACSHCLMFAFNGIPCTSCAEVIYCSEKCKNEAWLQYHDVECTVLSTLKYADNIQKYSLTSLMSVVRLFIISVKREGLQSIIKDVNDIYHLQEKDEHLQGFFDNGIFKSQKLKSILNLMSNDHPVGEKKVLTKIIKRTVKLLSNVPNFFDSTGNDSFSSLMPMNKPMCLAVETIIFKLVLILDSNCFKSQILKCNCSRSVEECKMTCGEVGVGQFTLSFCSLINHSCNYNTDRLVTENQEMVLYTVQPVKKGEQLFITYGSTIDMEIKDRRKMMKKDYNFTCNCVACSKKWPTDFMSIEAGDPRKIFKVILEMQKLEGFETAFRTVFGEDENKIFTKSMRKKVIKMVYAFYKTLPTHEAYINNLRCIDWISMYFENKFCMKMSNIPNEC